jgi:hypothetical protein
MMSNLYKPFLLTCAAIMLLSGMALAQSTNAAPGSDTQQSQNDQAQGRGQQRRRMAMLVRRLNLTEDQKRQWIQMQRQTAQQVKAMRADQSLNDEQKQAKLKELRKQQKDQVFAILTPEQQNELKKFWEEQRQKQQSDGASGDKPAPVKAAPGKEDSELDDLFADMTPDPDPAPAQPPTKNPKPYR